MSKNVSVIPYTELQERVLSLGRLPENSKQKVRGVIQDIYTREIPSKFDWDFLLASSAITTTEVYNTGTCSADTGDTAITFSSDAVLTADMTGRKIKVSGNDAIYNVTFSNATNATIVPSFEGAANASSVSYDIFEQKYALAGDFDRFPKDSGFYKWSGGRKQHVLEAHYQVYTDNFSPSPSDNPRDIRLIEKNTAGIQQVELSPPPRNKRNYGYDYIRQVSPLTETSAGTVTITAGATAVTGSTGCRFNEATTGDWLRVSDFGTGDDSSWYRILAIAHNSSLTLSTAFASSGVTNANYAISKAPEYPDRLHPAVLFGALRAVTLDQTDESFAVYNVKMAEVLTDAKRIHVTRTYSQKFPTIAEEFMYRR